MAWAWRASCSTPNNSARKGSSRARERRGHDLASEVSERGNLVSITLGFVPQQWRYQNLFCPRSSACASYPLTLGQAEVGVIALILRLQQRERIVSPCYISKVIEQRHA